jgi:hypothetical protein
MGFGVKQAVQADASQGVFHPLTRRSHQLPRLPAPSLFAACPPTGFHGPSTRYQPAR